MNNTDNPSANSWDKIQTGVGDVERLIGQKKYNMAMVKARQTLEYMVKCLCERTGIMEGSLIDMIDALYEEGVISKTTCEHYHKIRTIGNKAIHEEDNSAYNANQAHHLLSQEVYTFANDYNSRKKRPAPAPRRQDSGDAARRTRQASSSSASRRRRAHSSGFSIDPGSIVKPLLLIAIIIVLIFIIKMIHPGGDKAAESSEAIPSVEATYPTQEEPSTEAQETEPAPVMYKTTDTLNVRSTPSTDTARIGLLAPGTEVEFVGDYDDRWCIIKYNGQDAYVVKEYLTPSDQ